MAPMEPEDLEESDEEEDDDSDEEEEEVVQRPGGKSFVAQLVEDLQKNPYDQELHAALVSAFRESAQLEKLRRARDAAADRVALPESFWLEWLQDELPLATEPAEVEALDDLHRRACAMCPTGPVWLARCALHRERSSDAGKVRSVYEEALKVLGQHPGYGVEIWADYRDFEENLLSAAGADEKALQVQRVRTLFMRQMALPLPGRERLQETHQTFEGALEPKLQSRTAHAKMAALSAAAAERWAPREPLELKLREACRPSLVMVSTAPSGAAGASPAEIAEELLRLEEQSGEKERIACALLRCTQFDPKEVRHWIRLADVADAVEVLDRAVHHCPMEEELWMRLHAETEASAPSAPSAAARRVQQRGLAALGASAVRLRELVPADAPAEAAGSAAIPRGAAEAAGSADAAEAEAPRKPKPKPKPKEPAKRKAFRSQQQEKRQKTEPEAPPADAATAAEGGPAAQDGTAEDTAVEKPQPAVEEPPTEPTEPAASEDAAAAASEEHKSMEVEEAEDAEEVAQPHKGSHYHQRRLAEKAQDLKLEEEGQHTVFVANLDWSVDEAQLYRVFQDIDGLKDVRLVRDFLKRSKGYAYVDFQTPEQVTEAAEKFNGHLINNRAMKVARSLPTKQLYQERYFPQKVCLVPSWHPPHTPSQRVHGALGFLKRTHIPAPGWTSGSPGWKPAPAHRPIRDLQPGHPVKTVRSR
ncbi:unnamed protein product [Durusdinium trenchii]|uniref:RRM domain-containing protein n=1 Tax=Durusdinium trenchii TaxID=1381693 RepID=A0ABP0S625_9DINO